MENQIINQDTVDQISNQEVIDQINAQPKTETKKPKLDLTQLNSVEGVEIITKKSFTLIKKGEKKIALKGTMAEFNTITDIPNLNILTTEEIKQKHLGSMKALLKIENINHLQTVLEIYFK